MKTVLSTKKLSEKNKIVLENSGFLIIERNFIKVKPIRFQLETCNNIMLFTSKNAVKSVLQNKKERTAILEKECLCVGKKTKKFLKKKGFKVSDQAGNAKELGKLILKKYSDQSFTFFCGSLRRKELPEILTENGISFNEIKVYETALKPYKINIKTDAILFFSPSAVESFLKENILDDQMCFCIGRTTAKALENRTQNIEIANQPTVENVMEAVIKYYN
ncbi:uroporphyrinogen-III synthase [Flavobacterium sp. NRK F10]|uniref:uroporphyrinogen-III synthase n=1 Tax=Flavobacterium sp. NRK F10 TaxID=2954931 RepID=UPI00209045F6|nr:uroporphyrinogen-III synthase [Flavobacterium sp. NRK F10]MCO6174859.1 uroporphyrinogen-III synthase [Flavobacterium sp. NRK F10]